MLLHFRDALNKSAQASPICLLADQGASAKADWPSSEPAHRGDAGRQIGPNRLILNAGVMFRRPADRRARLAKAASLDGAAHTTLRSFWTSCRLRGLVQSIPGAPARRNAGPRAQAERKLMRISDSGHSGRSAQSWK